MAHTQRQAADGFDNAGALANITSSHLGVSSRGISYERYENMADGSAIGIGAPREVVEFRSTTNVRALSTTEYEAILTALGLTAVYDDVSNEITYRTNAYPGSSTYANYNAIVYHRRGDGDVIFEDDAVSFARFTFVLVEAL